MGLETLTMTSGQRLNSTRQSTMEMRVELSQRDKSGFGDTQQETEPRKRTTAVHRLLARVVKCVAFAVRLAFACGLVVPSQGQDILLTREFDLGGEQTSRISLDATGVYVVGQRGLPYAITGLFIRKTDFAGAELWTRQLGPSSGFGSAFGVAASPIGVYAIGAINQPLPNTQLASAFLEKYDAGGNVLWRRQFDTSNRDRMLGVAVNGNSIDVVGEANPLPGTGSSGGGLFVRRYDAAGNTLWTRQDQPGYSGSGAVAADDTGVYVHGYLSRTSPSAPHGEAIFKYDNNGNVMWRKVLSTGETEFLPSLAVDNTGLYMARAGSLIKFDTAGNEQWRQMYGAPLERVELAVDETGVYLAGTVPSTEPALAGQCASGYADAYVRKYDSGGSLLWIRQFGTSASDQVAGVAVDGAALWVAGFRYLGDPSTSFLTKLEKTKVAPDPSIPHITAECVVNAASYIGGGVAPGEIVTIFGAGIGPAELIKMPTREDGKIQTTLAETRILFNGVPAPVLFVSATQSSAIVPYAIAGLSAVDVQVEYKGVRSRVVSMPVAPARLGIFTLDGSGRGQATVLNDDGSLNTADNPAKQGSVIVLFVTGEGLTDPAGVEDHIIGDILPTPKLPLVAFMPWTDCGDCFTEVVSASSVRGSVPGLLEVKLRVPEQALRGSTVPLSLWNSGYFYSQPGVTLAIK
jgi:uncharacterized protein (TIGR03437 family)